MSANDKFGLGYGDHRYDGILSYENEVLQSVFMNKESELEKQPLYDRFVTAGGMHAVPPPMTGNYMPSGPDVEIDYSQFTYGPKQSQPSESETQNSDFDTCESDSSEPTVNEPKVVSQPKIWSDAPIIEEYASDSEDEHMKPEIQKLQMQAKIFKENSLNKLNALKSTTQLLERQTFSGCILYQQAFAQLFETLHEMDSKSALSVIKAQFEMFINSDLLKPLDFYSRSFSSDREVRENFRDYTKMTAQTFKETIIQNMDSIEQCIIERARSWRQELRMIVEKLSERQLADSTGQGSRGSISFNKFRRKQAVDVSDEEIEKRIGSPRPHYGFMAKIQEVSTLLINSTDTPLEQVQNNEKRNVFAMKDQHSEKHAAECADERAALANLIGGAKFNL
ncbi:hypothetical protein Tco_1439353 [Tanacetum coccineum]